MFTLTNWAQLLWLRGGSRDHLLPSSCCPLAGQLLGHFMSGAAQKGLKSVASKPVKLFGGFFCPSDYVCFQSFSEGFPGDLHGSNELEQGSAMYRGDLLGKEPASGPVLHAASQFWYLTLLESRRVSRWWPLINPAFPTQQSARCCYVQGAVHLQVGSPAELCSCPTPSKPSHGLCRALLQLTANEE